MSCGHHPILSILVSRFERIVDRVRAMRAATAGSTAQSATPDISTPLLRRMILLNHAIFLAVLSALCTAALLIVAFICALLGVGHNTGVALMFIIALALLIASLVELTREVRVSMKTMRFD